MGLLRQESRISSKKLCDVAVISWKNSEIQRDGHLGRSRRRAVAADFGAVHRRQAQKAKGGEEGEQGDQEKGETEIANRQRSWPGNDGEKRGADRDAKASRQLLRDTPDAGALAQIRRRYVGIADRVEGKILNAAQTAGQQDQEYDQPDCRVRAQQPEAGSDCGGEARVSGEQPAKTEPAQEGAGKHAYEHRAEARRERQQTRLQRAHPEPDLKKERQQKRRRIDPAQGTGNRADTE